MQQHPYMRFCARMRASKQWKLHGAALPVPYQGHLLGQLWRESRQRYRSGSPSAKRAKKDDAPLYCYHARAADNTENFEAVDGMQEHVSAGLGWYGTGAYCMLEPKSSIQYPVLMRARINRSQMVVIRTPDALESVESLAKQLYGAAFEVSGYNKGKAARERLVKALKLTSKEVPELAASIVPVLGNIDNFIKEYRQYFEQGSSILDKGLQMHVDPQNRPPRSGFWRRSPWTFMLMRAGWEGVMFADGMYDTNNTWGHGTVIFDVNAFELTPPPSSTAGASSVPPKASRKASDSSYASSPEESREAALARISRQVDAEIEEEDKEEEANNTRLLAYKPKPSDPDSPAGFLGMFFVMRHPLTVKTLAAKRSFWVTGHWGKDALKKIKKDSHLQRYFK